MLRLSVLAGLLFAVPATAQTQFTYAELGKLDTPAIARLLLGAAGEQMVEHRIGTDRGSFGGPATDTIRWVSFARAPEYRLDDTCEAETIELEFRPLQYIRGNDLPVRLYKLQASTRWGMLPPGGKDCRALGSVMDGWTGPYFNAKSTYGTDLNASSVGAAVAMLRGFLADPQTAGSCAAGIDFDGPDERQADCEQRRMSDILDPKRISRLNVGACRALRPSAGDAPMCVSFRFDDPSAYSGSGSYLQGAFEADLPAGAALTKAVKILRTSILKVTWVV